MNVSARCPGLLISAAYAMINTYSTGTGMTCVDGGAVYHTLFANSSVQNSSVQNCASFFVTLNKHVLKLLYVMSS